MTADRANRYWALIIIILVVVIAIAGAVVWSKYRVSQPIEISLPPTPEWHSEIYVGGAVNNPGFYSLREGDGIADIIQAAGGMTGDADHSTIKLYIPENGEEQQSQKIDLNRAEAWLLQALPGIGEVRAQAIIDYREKNGRFRNIVELTHIEGIGTTTYEQIKDFVTVAD